MSYNEPPEWQGRGPRSREGWPNSSVNPGAPRSHRAPGEDRTPIRRDDTGEFRPSREPYYEEMPTDPAILREVPIGQTPYGRPELVVAADPPAAEHIIMPISAPEDPVERFDLWLRLCVHILAIVALVAALWCLGMVIADRGVPLWVSRS
jgi:hypothetical protein